MSDAELLDALDVCEQEIALRSGLQWPRAVAGLRHEFWLGSFRACALRSLIEAALSEEPKIKGEKP